MVSQTKCWQGGGTTTKVSMEFVILHSFFISFSGEFVTANECSIDNCK